ncbi:MAG: hypothetical protein HC899_21685 [Leptolyngbyaceae cyanobacterium SM1_4_3]|nr:hypothetical protein [Leptolyngbyaceae cyanobacterium SM1_4_3]NJN89228.1 hypothetical protein [Leptolyngbyaceae cyanobacterium SL_5_14]
MLSLFAYGLTFGQAQANSELTLPEPCSFCTATKSSDALPDDSNQGFQSHQTNLLDPIHQLEQIYRLERRSFL